MLKVSETGYYRYLINKDKPYKHEHLLAQIYEILKEDPENSNYGVKRIHLALQINYKYKGSYSTVYRVYKENGLIIKYKRRPKGLTKADSQAQAAENLIKQDFSALEPNEKWLTDITEVPCRNGKLYLAPVLDCFDGSIVGFKMDDNMRAELCVDAFKWACKKHNTRGMVLHSDRGSQYTSHAFRIALNQYGAVQSMSSTGRCYDNARMESFFATLKKEKLYKIDTKNMTIEEVKTIIFRFIYYYNLRRIYTTNKGYPPMIYRQMYYHNRLAA